jgi:hypothetical protein
MNYRTATELLRQTAALVRDGVDLCNALLAVTHTESRNRWLNLVAGLATDLRCINGPDRDHPAAYSMRLQALQGWADRIGDAHEVAAWLDALANLAELELLAPSTSTIGGPALLGRHAALIGDAR